MSCAIDSHTLRLRTYSIAFSTRNWITKYTTNWLCCMCLVWFFVLIVSCLAKSCKRSPCGLRMFVDMALVMADVDTGWAGSLWVESRNMQAEVSWTRIISCSVVCEGRLKTYMITFKILILHRKHWSCGCNSTCNFRALNVYSNWLFLFAVSKC